MKTRHLLRTDTISKDTVHGGFLRKKNWKRE